MVNYECYRCGYTNNNKSNIIRHIGRKNICKPIISNDRLDVSKEYILNGLTYNEYINILKFDKNEPKMSQNEQFMSKNEHFDIENNNKCLYCNRTYKHVQSLNRHLKKCSEKHKSDEANKSMTELVTILNSQISDFKKELEEKNKELKKRDNQIDELIKKAGINNSTITQNIQNNIKILAYKDTDVSKLTDKDILKCMNHSNMCVPHLIKMIHLDPEKPENHNIYISNLKNGYIMVYDGGKWDTFNRDEIINNMIDDKQGLIEERIENWIEEGKKYPSIMRKFERYLEKKENNVVIDRIKEEIKLMLFNNRKLIKTKEVN